MKQISLLPKENLFHGGKLAIGKRKTRRPLSTKKAVHFVLKAKTANLFRHGNEIENLIQSFGHKFFLKTYGVAVNHDHVHFVLKIQRREDGIRFLRALTGTLSKRLKIKWRLLPFSRVVSWGRDFKYLLTYIKKNREEASGQRSYESRKDRYARYLKSD